MAKDKFCPFLLFTKRWSETKKSFLECCECKAVILVASPKAFKSHTYMPLTEADIKKCKTIWQQCPIYLTEIKK